MVRRFRIPALAFSLAVYFVCIMSFPAVAGLVPSVPSSKEMMGANREAEIHKVQKALEMKVVAEKLHAYGLSASEVKNKLESMSDEQIHMLAQASDRLLAGGDGLGLVIGVLIIIILVIIILKLMDKKIIIK